MKRSRVRQAVVPALLVMFAGAAAPVSAQVQWRGAGGPAVAMEHDVAGALARITEGVESRHVLVQLSARLTDAGRAAMDGAGLRIGAPVGPNMFFARADGARLDGGALVRSGWVLGVQAIDPAWKIHPMLTGGEDLSWAVVGRTGGREGAGDEIVAVYVLLHEGQINDARVAGMVERHGGQVQDLLATVNGAVAHVPRSAVAALAGEDTVQWVEPALPLLTPTNTQNRALTHVDQVQAAPYNLTGAGVTAFVFDGGTIRATHNDLAGRVTLVDSDFQSYHATHVAGTIGGTGAASGGTHRGMAPGVSFLSAGVSINADGWLYSNPTDIEQDYTAAYNQGADIANNSIGTNVNGNGFPCAWHGDYGVVDGVLDSMVRGSAVSGGEPFRIVWAAGNERGGRCDTGGFRTIGPPAGAKNHLSIGAVNANDDSMTSFSGWGPTDDGRLKPDFAAPGCQSGGDGGVTSCDSSSNTSYTVLCGTSMATPTVTGIASLMLQDFANSNPSSSWPRNSTLKVLLAQSAVDLGNAGPDYRFGYGSVRADAAVDLMRTGAFVEGQVGQNFIDRYVIDVPAGSGPLVVTTAWDDVPGTPNVIPSLVNDLDLRVFAPDGTRHYPWTLNPSSPNSAAQRTAEDHLNNLEQVRVDSPGAGQWVVEVYGGNVPQGPQPYSIVSSNDTFAFQGSVSLELEPVTLAGAYVDPGAPIDLEIRVDIQGDTLVPGSVAVHSRYDGGSYVTTAMVDQGAGLYRVTLPAPSCGDLPEYYFSAAGQLVGELRLPSEGPAAPYSSFVGEQTIAADDAMETDAGWTVGAAGDTANTGVWNRMDPEPTAAQPGDDHTPSGTMCWATDGRSGTTLGAFDVDGGATTLTSPVYDLTGMSDATGSYWRWYSNNTGGAPGTDTFVVDISNDGGATWTRVETVGPAGDGTMGGWFFHEFRVGDFVTPTANVRLRFVADDAGTGSIIEAAIDDLLIEAVSCTECAADFDGDGSLTLADFVGFRNAYTAGDLAADFNGDGGLTLADFVEFRNAYTAGCP